MTTLGHNGIAGDKLKSFVERIEALEGDKKAIADDIKDVYTEAESSGFDKKIIREVIKLRKLSKDERENRQALIETYMHALGMLADTPLGQAALAKLGTPSPLTEEEKARGGVAAFEKGGNRMSVELPERQTDLEDAVAANGGAKGSKRRRKGALPEGAGYRV